jgi:hypothetical protein
MNLENVGTKVWGSVWNSMRFFERDSMWDSVRDSMYNSVWDSVFDGLQLPIRKEGKQG